MKLLITGSAGFVGRALVRSVVEEGHDVLALDVQKQEDDSHTTVCDLLDRERLWQVTEEFRPQQIVHCGGISGPMLLNDQPALVAEININGTLNLLEAARKLEVSRFVFCSSIAAYGPSQSRSTVIEETHLSPTTVYAASKVAAEALVAAYGKSFNFSTTSLRIGKVFGLGRKTDCELRVLISNAIKGRLTRLESPPDYRHHYIYIDDVVDGIQKAIASQTELRSVYNIVSAEDPELQEIVGMVRAVVPETEVVYPDAAGSVERLPTPDFRAAADDLQFYASTALQEGVRRYASFLAYEGQAGELER